jgi:hypothetical protein
MKKTGIGKLLKRYMLPALALLLIAAFFILGQSREQTEFPALYPRDGVLDARAVDFSAGVYHLVNSWDYYPGQLLSPAVFSDPAAAPMKDNDAPLNITKGTWRLRIQAQPNTYLTLCSYSIDYSTRIFVNGQEVRSIGYVSDDPAWAVPKVRYVTLPLYFDDTGETEIAETSSDKKKIGKLVCGGKDYELKLGMNTIGRESPKSTATLQISTVDRTVSRVHAEIEVVRLENERIKVILRDIRSKEKIDAKPMFIEDQLIFPEDRVHLENGDTFKIGDTLVKYLQK